MIYDTPAQQRASDIERVRIALLRTEFHHTPNFILAAIIAGWPLERARREFDLQQLSTHERGI